MAVKYKSQAFSLVELSIVILVIGILIAAITKGKEIYHKISLAAARSITTSSSIATIPDLALWYETTLENSFLKEERENNSSISIWFDNNPRSTNSQKNNATNSNIDSQPKYVEKIFGSIPVIEFDGTNDLLNFDGNFLINSNYTLFIVEQRTSSKSVNYFFGSNGSNSARGSKLHIGYRHDTVLTHDHYYSILDTSVKSLASAPQPKIMTFMLDDEGKKIWISGGDQPYAKNNQTAKLLPNDYFWIGRGFTDTTYFKGYIAEVLMFSRDLTTKERNKVENYLGKKYNIKIKN